MGYILKLLKTLQTPFLSVTKKHCGMLKVIIIRRGKVAKFHQLRGIPPRVNSVQVIQELEEFPTMALLNLTLTPDANDVAEAETIDDASKVGDTKKAAVDIDGTDGLQKATEDSVAAKALPEAQNMIEDQVTAEAQNVANVHLMTTWAKATAEAKKDEV